jgi:exodeoxyribonuclease VIII
MSTAELSTSVLADGEWRCSNEEYHADCTHVGKSMLDDFRRSRRLYEARYVTRTMPRAEQSNGMLRGSMLHMRLLEPERFEQSVIIEPQFDRRTKIGREAYDNFHQRVSQYKKTVIDEEMFHCVNDMAKAVKANERAATLLGFDGQVEHSIKWTDPETGLACKARRDKACVGLILDVKTCEGATPFSFARAAAYYAYHRQAALYLDGEKQYSGADCAFVFIVVSHEPPYQCACYELDDAAIDRGRQENRELLAALAECYRTGDWGDPFERQITRLALPDWIHRDDYRML